MKQSTNAEIPCCMAFTEKANININTLVCFYFVVKKNNFPTVDKAQSG